MKKYRQIKTEQSHSFYLNAEHYLTFDILEMLLFRVRKVC